MPLCSWASVICRLSLWCEWMWISTTFRALTTCVLSSVLRESGRGGQVGSKLDIWEGSVPAIANMGGGYGRDQQAARCLLRALQAVLRESCWGNPSWGPGREQITLCSSSLPARVLCRCSARCIRNHLPKPLLRLIMNCWKVKKFRLVSHGNFNSALLCVSITVEY